MMTPCNGWAPFDGCADSVRKPPTTWDELIFLVSMLLLGVVTIVVAALTDRRAKRLAERGDLGLGEVEGEAAASVGDAEGEGLAEGEVEGGSAALGELEQEHGSVVVGEGGVPGERASVLLLVGDGPDVPAGAGGAALEADVDAVASARLRPAPTLADTLPGPRRDAEVHAAEGADLPGDPLPGRRCPLSTHGESLAK